MSYTNDKLLKIVNGHGYFLQQVVEYTTKALVRSGTSDWRVAGTEHYWEHKESGARGYADVVIEQPVSNMVAVVECKRYGKETPWIFLCPNQPYEGLGYSSLHWSYRRDSGHGVPGSSVFIHRPATYEAKFCIVDGQDAKKPMREGIAGPLLYSVEAIAKQYSSLTHSKNPKGLVFLPIILTTAQLHICKYSHENLDRDTGTLPEGKASFEQVKYIRFTKVFTGSNLYLGSIERFSDIERLQTQTVFVVQASALPEFLMLTRELRPDNEEGKMPWV